MSPAQRGASLGRPADAGNTTLNQTKPPNQPTNQPLAPQNCARRTPNCISTAEEANDDAHFVPGWAYDPSGKRGKTQAQAMAELAEVVGSLQPDGFTPTIVQQTEDYLYAEYQSPTFGCVGGGAGF